MAFRLPTFNLLCNIGVALPGFPGPNPTPSQRLENVPCQLTFGRRVNVTSTGGTSSEGVLTIAMSLLLPKGTDIRGPQDSVAADNVEVPAFSGRWYRVVAVDDVGKGFSNEYRNAAIFAVDRLWLAPYP